MTAVENTGVEGIQTILTSLLGKGFTGEIAEICNCPFHFSVICPLDHHIQDSVLNMGSFL